MLARSPASPKAVDLRVSCTSHTTGVRTFHDCDVNIGVSFHAGLRRHGRVIGERENARSEDSQKAHQS